MPEEQAFCVLVKIMFDYGLRALYRNNFEDLHCKFYQLERLMQVTPPPASVCYLSGEHHPEPAGHVGISSASGSDPSRSTKCAHCKAVDIDC